MKEQQKAPWYCHGALYSIFIYPYVLQSLLIFSCDSLSNGLFFDKLFLHLFFMEDEV